MIAHTPRFLTLIRHTEYDETTGDLTPFGRDTVGHIAAHLGFLQERHNVIPGETNADRLFRKINQVVLPPIDLILHSDAPRTTAAAQIFHEMMAARCERTKKRVKLLGAVPWLQEQAYPARYDHFSFYNLVDNTIDYADFRDIAGFLAEPHGAQHIVMVTHAPSLRAISLAAMGGGISHQPRNETDLICAEHKLRIEKKAFGTTVCLTAQSWQEIMGSARMIAAPFVPPAENTIGQSATLRTLALAGIAREIQHAK